MAETEVLETKVASTGRPERAKFSIDEERIQDQNFEAEQNTDTKVPIVDKPNVNADAPKEIIDPEKKEPISFTDEQKKEFLKSMFGEDADLETIKEKLKPSPLEPTEEEKRKTLAEKELRLLKLYVDNGGTPEDYNVIKNLATSDIKELSKNEIISELKAEGFSEKEANDILKQRYLQIELDAIEQDTDNDESDEEFAARKKSLQRKVDYGTKKLENHSSYKQAQAQGILKGLEEIIRTDELRQKEEATLSSNVDETLKSYQRKQTYELGQSDDRQLNPITHEVSEESITKTADILKDAAKRKQFFNNKDGSLNLPNLTDFFIKYFEYNRAIKGAFLEGESRNTAEIQKTFPARTPYELGLGIASQNKNNKKGAAMTAGKAQRVSPQHN